MFWVVVWTERQFLPHRSRARIEKAQSRLVPCAAEFQVTRFLWEELGLESHLGWATLEWLPVGVLMCRLLEDPTCLES